MHFNIHSFLLSCTAIVPQSRQNTDRQWRFAFGEEFMDDDYHCCQKQLRSSRSRMEPYICSEGFDSATYGASLDLNSSQPKESLFQSLYH